MQWGTKDSKTIKKIYLAGNNNIFAYIHLHTFTSRNNLFLLGEYAFNIVFFSLVKTIVYSI